MSRIVSESKLRLIDIETGEIIKEMGGKDKVISIGETSKKSLEYLHSLMANTDNFVKRYKHGISYEIIKKMCSTDMVVLSCLINHIGNCNNICMYENGVILKPRHIISEIRWK